MTWQAPATRAAHTAALRCAHHAATPANNLSPASGAQPTKEPS